MIYNEDCFTTQNRPIEYDYVLTSPPDYEEIGMKPGDDNYGFFLSKRLTSLAPKSGYMTIFISDRKYIGSEIVTDIYNIGNTRIEEWKTINA